MRGVVVVSRSLLTVLVPTNKHQTHPELIIGYYPSTSLVSTLGGPPGPSSTQGPFTPTYS